MYGYNAGPNFSGLGSERKQKEIGELLTKNSIDVAGQEFWEREDTRSYNIWREVVEKANTDFDGSRKDFSAFVGRRTRGKVKKNIPLLKSEAGVSVTSTRGKLEVLQRHYQQLGKLSLDSNFDAQWKEEVGSNMVACQSCVKMSF